jgi:hypothetical protein
MNLMIRSIGIKRAEATIIMANIASPLGRWRGWEGRPLDGQARGKPSPEHAPDEANLASSPRYPAG